MEIRKKAWIGNHQVCTTIVIVGGTMVLGSVIRHYCHADAVRFQGITHQVSRFMADS